MKTKIKRDAVKVAKALRECKGTVYTFGNGGSASIADHMACDWMKGTQGRIRVISLSSNGPLLSAIGNDLGYRETCATQLLYLLKQKDLVVLISSSGTSPNIIQGGDYAFSRGVPIIGFTGFAGGVLKSLSTLSVHIKSNDYGVIEDYHSQVMHEVVRLLK